MDSKGRPFPDPVALDANVAAMQFDKLLDDSHSQPQSAMATSCRRVPLLKTVEDIRQELRRDAFTRITDADFDMRVDAFEQHLDLSALGCELDGVVKEIPKNLLQAIRVAGDPSCTEDPQPIAGECLSPSPWRVQCRLTRSGPREDRFALRRVVPFRR